MTAGSAGAPPAGGRPAPAPLYARVLRLRHIRPSGTVCFLFFEGAIALGVLLALAELVSWWAVPALPVVVALMVKLNDLLAGQLAGGRPAGAVPAEPAGAEPESDWLAGEPDRAHPVAPRQVSRDLSDTLDPADSPRQRSRQSARRRYR